MLYIFCENSPRMSITPYTCNICVKLVTSVVPVRGVGCHGETYITKLQAVVPEVEWSPDYRICQSCELELDAAYEFRERSIRLDFERRVAGAPKITRPLYPCYTCGKLFVDCQQLSEHIDREHPEAEDVQSISTNVQILSEHMYAKQYIETDIFECEPLPKSVGCENGSLKVATREKRERQVPFGSVLRARLELRGGGSCQVCGVTRTTANEVVEHCIKEHHLDKQEIKPFPCDKCHKRFPSWHRLQAHQIHHSEKRDFLCTHCGRGFKSKMKVILHEECHLNLRKYKCELCSKAYNTTSHLWYHVKAAHFGSKEKKFVCHLCNKRILTRQSLDEHIRRHKGEKPFNCHLCNSSFVTQGELKKHLKGHAFIKEIHPFKCQHCDKTYKLNISYKLHLRRDHGIGNAKLPENKHKCGVCGKKFHSKARLEDHVHGHVGISRHLCEVCGNKYSNRTALNTHRKEKHETEPPAINLLQLLK